MGMGLLQEHPTQEERAHNGNYHESDPAEPCLTGRHCWSLSCGTVHCERLNSSAAPAAAQCLRSALPARCFG